MPEQATLRLQGEGDVEIELLARFLADLDRAYASVMMFERLLKRFEGGRWPIAWDAWLFGPFPVRRTLRGGGGSSADWAEATISVPIRDRLRLARVELASPGFWEVVGSLNPLEVTRKYLDDRHRRRQDREYRESAEQRQLELENLMRENAVMAERIRIAKELGLTDADLAPLIRELIERPLVKLGEHQDRGVIGAASIQKPARDG